MHTNDVHSIRLGNFKTTLFLSYTHTYNHSHIDKIDQYLPEGKVFKIMCSIMFTTYTNTYPYNRERWQLTTQNNKLPQQSNYFLSSIWKWCIYVHVNCVQKRIHIFHTFRVDFELWNYAMFVCLLQRSSCVQHFRCWFDFQNALAKTFDAPQTKWFVVVIVALVML